MNVIYSNHVNSLKHNMAKMMKHITTLVTETEVCRNISQSRVDTSHGRSSFKDSWY